MVSMTLAVTANALLQITNVISQNTIVGPFAFEVLSACALDAHVHGGISAMWCHCHVGRQLGYQLEKKNKGGMQITNVKNFNKNSDGEE